eukprot:COSAG04_NODE_1678_length_5966_cov_3.433612_4_plen_310_part_00
MCRLRDNHDCEYAHMSGVGRGTYKGEEIWRGAYSGKYQTRRWKVFPRNSMREEMLRILLRDESNSEDENDLDDESYDHATRDTPEQEQRLRQMPYPERSRQSHAGFLVVADSDLEDEWAFEGFKKPGWHFMPGIEQRGDFEGYASDKQEPLEYTENVEHLAVRLTRNGLVSETSAADSSSDDEDYMYSSSEDEDDESQFEPWATVWTKLLEDERRHHDPRASSGLARVSLPVRWTVCSIWASACLIWILHSCSCSTTSAGSTSDRWSSSLSPKIRRSNHSLWYTPSGSWSRHSARNFSMASSPYSPVSV